MNPFHEILITSGLIAYEPVRFKMNGSFYTDESTEKTPDTTTITYHDIHQWRAQVTLPDNDRPHVYYKMLNGDVKVEYTTEGLQELISESRPTPAAEGA